MNDAAPPAAATFLERLEAVEVITAATATELAAETADLLYHVLVLLAAADLPLRQVLEILAARAGGRSR